MTNSATRAVTSSRNPSATIPPPLEPDSYIPTDRKPPPPNMDFEMGD